MDKRDFISFVERANQNFTFVVVDSTGHSNEPADFLKLVRAVSQQKVLSREDKHIEFQQTQQEDAE